jgi:membrane protein
VAAPGTLTQKQQRKPFPEKAPAKPAQQISGALLVMAALVGITRAFFGPPTRGTTGVAVAAAGREGVPEGGRGRSADKPTEIPAKGWKDIAWRVYEGIQNDRVLLVAAGVTFYALLALFPATAALVSLYGLFADTSTVMDHLRMASGFLPDGALEVVGDQVKRIAAQGQASLGVAFLGTLALSLWGANAGTKAIFDALNIIYKEREKRSFIRLTLWSLAFTFATILLVLLAFAGIVAVPVALKLFGIPDQSGAAWLTLLRWPLLYIVVLFALACLYRYGPSRTKPQWRWVSWGSAVAGAIWLVGSLLLSWYVANFANYNATYGSLGAVIGFMVWIWLSTIIVLLGAEINAEMEHQTAKDTTEGAGKPMGARGAQMADELGEARV